jgi:hypothetical protein
LIEVAETFFEINKKEKEKILKGEKEALNRLKKKLKACSKLLLNVYKEIIKIEKS